LAKALEFARLGLKESMRENNGLKYGAMRGAELRRVERLKKRVARLTTRLARPSRHVAPLLRHGQATATGN
jgi:hypothetical protein